MIGLGGIDHREGEEKRDETELNYSSWITGFTHRYLTSLLSISMIVTYSLTQSQKSSISCITSSIFTSTV